MVSETQTTYGSGYEHLEHLLFVAVSLVSLLQGGEFSYLSTMPTETWTWNLVFRKSCGTVPPEGRLYLLTSPEMKAIHKYISDALSAGIFQPCSSPAGAGFFFVDRDHSLRPCTCYCGLSDITVNNCYPLALVSSAFENWHVAFLFIKLGIQRNGYQLVQTREGDDTIWRGWTKPFLVWTDHKNLKYIRTANCFNSRQAGRWALFS